MYRCERTSAEWFAEAVHCYVANHQGCAWCGGSYRVFHTQRGTRHEYYCNGCDFRAGYDPAAKTYFSFPGEEHAGEQPTTMSEN